MKSGLFGVAGRAALVAAVLFTAHPVKARDAGRGEDKQLEATAGLTRQDGLLPVYVDKDKGRILLALPPADASGISGRFLYVSALKTGLGSALVGLDRARLNDTQILVFRRIGQRVVAEYENPRFVASGAPADEQAAARDAFAVSTVWAGKVEGLTVDGRILVDIASFLTRDVGNVAGAMKLADEGEFKLVPDLSLADPGAVKVFPENLEFEARETFSFDRPGPETRNIAPTRSS